MGTTAISNTAVKGLGYLSTKPAERLKQAGHSLEATFIGHMLKAAQPKGVKQSFAASTFHDMLSDTLSQKMADSNMLGIADMMVKQTLAKDVERADPATIAALTLTAPNTSLTPPEHNTSLLQEAPNTSLLSEGSSDTPSSVPPYSAAEVKHTYAD